MGQSYAQGEGVVCDMVEALKWYSQAAAHGDTDALYELGMCYAYGRGIERDTVRAVSC